jgi:beta-glucosidase/6-phospho-beta-glucosidase/beta-galactosidase
MFITAMFSAQYGWWNERLSDERSFVTALKNLTKANLMAMHEIIKVQPDAVFIQSESCEYFHPEDPSCNAKANLLNQKRFLALDLTLGHRPNQLMNTYLTTNGVNKKDLEWYLNNPCPGKFILGTDYYWTNEHTVHPNGSTSASGDLYGYYTIAKDYYNRYHVPLMHTETNMKEPGAINWLFKQWTNLYKLVCDGIPVLGFTWYSLIDQVDWDTALRENNGNINTLGMYDTNREIRPLGEAYHKLIAQWGPIMNEHLTQMFQKTKTKSRKTAKAKSVVEVSRQLVK